MGRWIWWLDRCTSLANDPPALNGTAASWLEYQISVPSTHRSQNFRGWGSGIDIPPTTFEIYPKPFAVYTSNNEISAHRRERRLGVVRARQAAAAAAEEAVAARAVRAEELAAEAAAEAEARAQAIARAKLACKEAEVQDGGGAGSPSGAGSTVRGSMTVCKLNWVQDCGG